MQSSILFTNMEQPKKWSTVGNLASLKSKDIFKEVIKRNNKCRAESNNKFLNDFEQVTALNCYWCKSSRMLLVKQLKFDGLILNFQRNFQFPYQQCFGYCFFLYFFSIILKSLFRNGFSPFSAEYLSNLELQSLLRESFIPSFKHHALSPVYFSLRFSVAKIEWYTILFFKRSERCYESREILLR